MRGTELGLGITFRDGVGREDSTQETQEGQSLKQKENQHSRIPEAKLKKKQKKFSRIKERSTESNASEKVRKMKTECWPLDFTDYC